MNLEQTNRASGAAIAFIVGSLLFLVVSLAVGLLNNAPAIDVDAGVKRAQALAKIHAAETAGLNQVGWIDQPRGIVRLPIDTAMQLSVQAWQNPAQARADLMEREKKATAPAPVTPAKPSAFE